MTGRALCLALLAFGCQRASTPPASPSPASTGQSACAAALPGIATQPAKARLSAMAKACQWSSAEADIARLAQGAPADLAGLAAKLQAVPLEDACPGATQLLSTLGPGVDARPAIIKRCGLTGVSPATPAASLMAAGILAHALRTRGVPDPIAVLAEPLGLTR